MTDPITTAREQTARVLATRELSCWEGEYSPEPEEYDDAHRRTTRAILEPSGPLAPLCAAYEAQLAEVTRERDEARAEVERMRKHVAEAVAAERERWRPVLDAVVRELACKGEHRGNAPGHAHSIPGVWDSDNGPIAGTPCSWCTAWKIARELLDAEAIRTRAEKETK